MTTITSVNTRISSRGREWIKGKPLGNDLRRVLVVELKENGSDEVSRTIPLGVVSKCAQKFRVSRATVIRVWNRHCDTGSVSPKKQITGPEKKLTDDDRRYIELLKTERPSITAEEIQRKLEENANVTVSKTTIGRTVRHGLAHGKWTRKRMIRPASERFTERNLLYTQDYLDALNMIDPMRIRFMDESGFNLSNMNSRYGHSPMGLRAVEIQRYNPGANYTLNLMISPFGVSHANVLRGASNTDTYLNFFHETSQTVMENGVSAILPGDVVVVDNCPIHHNRGGEILSEFLDNLGVEYVFTPTYSPDLNAAEYAFRHLKTVFTRPFYKQLANDNLEYAILRAVSDITPSQCLGFYRSVGYLNL
ncbi:uncharacterized protein [Ptychodera flava]|uniref:uncharacterized protein n=1 Tax=Ptychodera flava TaxID=63121 RepID=UPI00396A4BF4